LKSIKSSFANCSVCPLLDAPSCILETNCENDISKVEIVFIAENPGKKEVERGVPLIGKAGQMFRRYFKKFKLDKYKYLLTNVVLCQTLDEEGNTGNPEQKVIDLCKSNCMEIISACDPKLIVIMGGSPMSAFGFGKAGITKIHGDVVEWQGRKAVILVHPSFVNRNVVTWEPKFEEAMAKVAELMGEKHISVKSGAKIKTLGKGIFRYKIPEKFYTDKYRLVDIHFLNKGNQVIYIFRDDKNNKVYHKMNDDYVCYQVPKDVRPEKIVEYDKLNQIVINYRDRYGLDPDITYEGDVKICTKHTMDYYHYNKGEPPKVTSNTMFFDIEVDTGKEKVFPTPTEAAFPINMLTTIFNGRKICYVVDNKTEPIIKHEGIEYKIFKGEKVLLKEFIKDFKEAAPDFLAGWNCISFDLAYIFNRMPKLGMNQGTMSSFGEFYVDGSKYICHIPGCVAVDQDFLYKTFTFTKMENYKLAFISQHELGVTKIDLPLPFNEMYWKMLNKTIEYNIRDTDLLEQLDDKLDHINLLNELRIVCNSAFENTSPFGQIDSLMVSFLRERGWASKNTNPHIKKVPYPGAFVFEPIPGVYEDITDFDFASLYPSR